MVEKSRPHIGRWETTEGGRVELIASRCASCGEVLFPERAACLRCGGNSLEEVRLAGPASLYSHTVIHQMPQGFQAPMVGGYGEFPEGVLVFAPIDARESDLKPGTLLDLHERVTRVDQDGEPLVTYGYRPVAG